jgi:uncharacterized protein (TIGR02646 family)
MRPIQKWAVGFINPETQKAILEKYEPSNTARPDLEDNFGSYCGYCEVFNTTTQVDHIVSKDQISQKKLPKEMKYLWENFIMACSKCNGKDNKTNNEVDFEKMYFPDRNNTFMAFTYGEGGFVSVNPKLSNKQKFKAQALMELVCLDKYLGNPKYPESKFNSRSDKRWFHRDVAWQHAVKSLAEYEAGQVDAAGVANIAHCRGFFSVWFTVFMAHKEVKKALIDRFEGTATDCFDDDYYPIPRNPKNLDDTL